MAILCFIAGLIGFGLGIKYWTTRVIKQHGHEKHPEDAKINADKS